ATHSPRFSGNAILRRFARAMGINVEDSGVAVRYHFLPRRVVLFAIFGTIIIGSATIYWREGHPLPVLTTTDMEQVFQAKTLSDCEHLVGPASTATENEIACARKGGAPISEEVSLLTWHYRDQDNRSSTLLAAFKKTTGEKLWSLIVVRP